MAKEYKFMFDRSFDDIDEDTVVIPVEKEEDVPKNPILSILNAVDGILNSEQTSPDLSSVFHQNDESVSEEETQEQPEVVLLPSFSEEEMQAAKSLAFEEGRVLGQQQGQEEGHRVGFDEGKSSGIQEGHDLAMRDFLETQQKKDGDLLQALAEKLTLFAQDSLQRDDHTFSDAILIAKALIDRILPVYCSRHGADEITAFLNEAFSCLKEEPKVTVRLHPDMLTAVKTSLPDVLSKAGFPGKILLSKDDTLASGDCVVEWKNGGVERKMAEILKKTDALLQQYAQKASVRTEKNSTETAVDKKEI